MTAADFRREIDERIDRSLEEMADAGELSDTTPGHAERLAHAAVRAIRTANRVTTQVGPLYSRDRVMKVLGVGSRQALHDRIRRHALLRVFSAEGQALFPVLQFRDGAVDPGLVPYLKILLGSGASGWTVLYWLTSPAARFGGRTPLQVVEAGDREELAQLTAVARDDAAGWSQVA
ncbi:hypothetical protein NBM05_12200 [Rothia sp. AR01]|uniref:Antitoxin Xre/MbcA/ParS-like toxin-binding domain-containing protein n=1 Tax=Rothia santali TaxID=2949643 RepID=A0A9X2HCA6_9MICC|nr:hypothetical protein [Rothia santali]MCP3426741.1 hypothetical protein [Rothia santali]